MYRLTALQTSQMQLVVAVIVRNIAVQTFPARPACTAYEKSRFFHFIQISVNGTHAHRRSAAFLYGADDVLGRQIHIGPGTEKSKQFFSLLRHVHKIPALSKLQLIRK